MSSALLALLEDFAQPVTAPISAESEAAGQTAVEAAALASFEEGYKAGWDDAVKAQNTDKDRLSADLAQNLQDLSFTFHEAVGHVVRATSPLLNQMVECVLPELAHKALGLHIVQQLETRLQDVAEPCVEIRVSEADRAAVAPLLDRDFGFPVSLVAAPELVSGQADMRFAEEERQIDLTEVISGLDALLSGFLYENEKGLKHG